MSFLRGLFGPPNIEKLKGRRNVQGLIGALEYRKDWKIRLAAANALGELKDATATRPLVGLKDSHGVVGRAAMDAVEKIGAAGFGTLCAALEDLDQYVRNRAIEALGKIGDPRAGEPLRAALKDRDADNRNLALEALVRMGISTVGSLCATLKDTNRETREWAATGLLRFGDAQAVEPLCVALKDTASGVRRHAACALARIGDARALESPSVPLSKIPTHMCGSGLRKR